MSGIQIIDLSAQGGSTPAREGLGPSSAATVGAGPATAATAAPAPGPTVRAAVAGGNPPQTSKKGRKFFHKVQPTFSIAPSAPQTQLCFLDNSDPKKDAIVRKKAREWVWKNKHKDTDASKRKDGTKKAAKSEGDRRSEHGKMVMFRGVDRRKVSPLNDISMGSVDPFGTLPAVGRKIDHIIEYFLTSCPEQIPCCDDYRAWRPPQGALLKTQENTILGHMSGEHVSFIVWLHATTLIRDGIAGRWDSEEAHFYFRLALTTMREASQRPIQDYTDTFLGAMGCFTACACFSGMYEAAEHHSSALLRALKLKGNGDLTAGFMALKPWMRKALQWCEYGVASASPRMPILPRTPQPKAGIIPPEVVAEADRLTLITLANLPPLADPLCNIIRLKHQITIMHAEPKSEYSTWGGRATLNPAVLQPLYDVEMAILEVLTAEKESGRRFTEVEILLAEVSQLYFWVALRALPPMMRMCELFVTRVKAALTPLLNSTSRPAYSTAGSSTSSIIDGRGTAASASVGSESSAQATTFGMNPVDNLITWAFFLGTLVSSVNFRPEYPWYLEQFRLHARSRGMIRDTADLERVLKLFPYLEGFCGLGIKKLNMDFGV